MVTGCWSKARLDRQFFGDGSPLVSSGDLLPLEGADEPIILDFPGNRGAAFSREERVRVSALPLGVLRKVRTATGFWKAALLCLAAVAEPNFAHATDRAAAGGGLGAFYGASISGIDADVVTYRDRPVGPGYLGVRYGRDHWWWHHYPYLREEDGVFDNYDTYGPSQASQFRYYCSDPAGYYPNVAQCSVPWQMVDLDLLPVEPVPTG